jgi:hypothetical protein
VIMAAPSSWPGQVVRAIATVLLVAAGARIAWALLAPAVPAFVALLLIVTIYGVALGTLRRGSK